MGAVIASTDAAAVFFLLHARGLRLRPRVERDPGGGIRHQRSVRDLSHHRAGGNSAGRQQAPGSRSSVLLAQETILGSLVGLAGGRAVVFVLNRLDLAAGAARAVRRDRSAGHLRVSPQAVHGSGLSRRLHRRPGGRKQRHAGAQHRRRLPRRRDLAGADRDVRAARPAGVAGPSAASRLAGARGGRRADAGRAAGGGVSLASRRFASACARSCSSPGSACAAPSASSSPRFRCWSGCRTRISISTWASWSFWSRCWCRAGPSPRRRAGSTSRFRAVIPLPRRVELDLPGQLEQEIVGYPAARQQSLSSPRPVAVLGAADADRARPTHPDARPRRRACARATISICWRRPRRRRRSTASSSTCRRRRRRIRACSATSSSPAT